MKEKVFTAAAMASILGAYSVGVYHFSDNLDSTNAESSPALPSPTDGGEHVERIMRAIQTQGPARVETNLPVPGVSCDIVVTDTTESYLTDFEVDYCLDAVYAGLKR